MKSFFCIALFNFFFLAFSFAQEPIDITNHKESSYIGKQISYFEDKEGTFSIQSIASSTDKLFLSYDKDILNFGFSQSIFWLKLAVKNSDSLSNWILEIRNPDLDRVTLYYKDEKGSWKERSDGDTWPFQKKEIDSRNIAFNLTSNHEGTSLYYIKIKSIGNILIPVKIEKYDFFIRENFKSELFFGICYGILLIMLFYNLFIYFSIREISYIYYVLTVTLAILFYGLYYGHIPQYITHFRSPALNNLLTVIGILWSISILQFVKIFLNLALVSSFFNRLLNLMILLFFLNLLTLLFIDSTLPAQINAILAFPSIIIVLVSNFLALKKGNRAARFFTLAWSLYLLSIIIFVLRNFGLFPDYGFIMNILLIGNIIEVSLQSFALADKINIYRLQKEQAQAQIIQLKDQDAALLEQKVKERTIQLENKNQEITILNKDLDAFSHSASHDLRSPLRSITGFAALLEKNSASVLSEESKTYLTIIRNSAKTMDQLIEDLLAFSYLGKKELIMEEINMKELIEKVVNDFRLALKKDQIMDIKIGLIENSLGDPVLLKQVWVNLISNAIKYSMKKPKTEIEIGSKTSDKEVIYWIKDHGAGFDMQHADKLFQAFQRLHSQTDFEGTGLGLSIVKKIITKHGGGVWAEGKEGEGATFYFSLPKSIIKIK